MIMWLEQPLRRWTQKLASPVASSSLCFFRACFGGVMLYESMWFLGLTPGSPSQPNMVEYWYSGQQVNWNFPLLPIDWIHPLAEPWMTVVFACMAIASLGVLLGILYRVAILGLATSFTYVFLIEAAFYQNHFYLACLLAWLLAFMPADRQFAMGVWWRHRGRTSDIPTQIPFWCLFVLRGQLMLVYFFAGIAKINSDWLAGEPLRTWLRQPIDGTYLGTLLSPSSIPTVEFILSREWTVWLMCYGGLCFDLTIGGLLLFRRTRPMAIIMLIVFHGFNYFLLPVGAFPILALVCTIIFLDPDWPRSCLRSLSRSAAHASSGHIAMQTATIQWLPITLVFAWLVVQSVIPMRHAVIAGPVNWTEEGHRYSWHMMLRSKSPGPFEIELRGLPASARSMSHDLGREAAVAYVQVDNQQAVWKILPDLVICYEPLVGERIFLNPASSADWRSAAASARATWFDRFGVTPRFRRTWTLQDALTRLATAVSASQPSTQRTRMLRDLRMALQLDADVQARPPEDVRRAQLILNLQEVLHRTVTHDRWRKQALGLLMQTTPFAMQGAAPTQLPFMVAVAPEVMEQGDFAAVQIDRSHWPNDSAVVVDLKHMSPLHMRAMPRLIHLLDSGRQKTVWNYARDLHRGQYNHLRRSPIAQHKYAQRIARLCEADLGVRPEVYVTSYVQLNGHSPRIMIDPNVDLGGARCHLLRHNRWILPETKELEPRPTWATRNGTRDPRSSAAIAQNR